MFKDAILNNIIKEMQIVRRLSTKIPSDKVHYKHKEDVRSILEVLQYLTICGTGFVQYWYRKDQSDFQTFYVPLRAKAATVTHETFLTAMDEQIALIKSLFANISEEDLLNKIVDYPWGDKAPLGEALIQTSIKWLAAYKLQLFSLIKHATDQKLTTPDAWRLTEIEPVEQNQ